MPNRWCAQLAAVHAADVIEWGDMFDFFTGPLLAVGEAAGGSAPASDEDGSEREPAQIIESLESTITRFERLIENRSDDDLRQPAQDGRWGIAEILSHLEDWEFVFHERVHRILTEDTPDLERQDDTLWAIEHDYDSQDGHVVFARFAEKRRVLVEQLRRLGESAWDRPANIVGEKATTLRLLLAWLVEHDMRHFGQAQDVLG